MKKYFLFLLFLSLYTSPIFAGESTTAPNSFEGISNSLDADFFKKNQMGDVSQELRCMQSQAESGSLFSQNAAKRQIEIFAPHLQQAFRKLKMGPKEKALFYSQILVESSFFTQFSETKNHDSTRTNEDTPDKNLAMNALVKTLVQDDNFSQRKGATHSSEFGQFRGRGLIQLTGCDNYLSTLDYLNKQYRDKEPSWQPYWYASKEKNPDEKDQIGSVCSEKQLEKMKSIYEQKNPGQSLDLFGALSNLSLMGIPGTRFKDNRLNRTIASEQFMVDMALAYWRGRCGELANKTIRAPKSWGSQYCPSIPDRSKMTDDEVISRCTTKCVRGVEGSAKLPGGWGERNKWFLRAQKCVKH